MYLLKTVKGDITKITDVQAIQLNEHLRRNYFMEKDIKYRYNDLSERYHKMNCFYVIAACLIWTMYLV